MSPTIAAIIGIVAMIVSVGGFVLSVKRQPFDVEKLKSDIGQTTANTIKIYSDMVQQSAAQEVVTQQRWELREKTYQTQIEAISTKVTDLENHQDELDRQLHTAHLTIRQLQEWCEQLSNQVRKLGGIPVKIGTGPLSGESK